jgi:macrodomain Ter protein organizer (MatP/YcbG family)
MNINTTLQSKMSPKAFHEDMQVAIWSWIREWCEVEHHPELSGLPQSPGDVLRWLIFKIGDCGGDSQDSMCPFVVEGGEDQWRGSHLFKFAEKMCQVGQRLYDEDLQDRILWRTMKEILEFYLHESTTYINNINSLGLSANEINSFFELGLDLSNDTYTVEGFRNQIIWSRYITSRKAWKFNLSTRSFDTTCEASPELWAFWVTEHIDSLLLNMLDEMIQAGSVQQFVALEKEEQKKKNAAIRKIQETLDEVKEDLDDGLFLQMMNLMKNNYVVSP